MVGDGDEVPSWRGFHLAQELTERAVATYISGEPVGGIIAEHRLEDRGEVGSDDFLVIDVELLEHGLVQVAPLVAIGRQVRLMGAGEQCAAVGQFGTQRFFGQAGAAEYPLCGNLLGGDAQLLPFEVFDVDSVGVVGLQQLV